MEQNYHLTHWGRVTHICVSELTIIGSDNGLSPGRRQAIIWNNAGLLLIESLGTNVSEISIGIQTFSFKKMHLNMSSAKRQPFCLGLNVLILHSQHNDYWCQGINSHVIKTFSVCRSQAWINFCCHQNNWYIFRIGFYKKTNTAFPFASNNVDDIVYFLRTLSNDIIHISVIYMS